MRYFTVLITSIVLLAFMNFNIIKGIFSDKKVIYTKPNHMESLGSFYDFKVNSLSGKPFDLSVYKGKKVVIINTASKCGFTPQYADWQKFHEKYGDKIAILGFPANDFMRQEPGTNSDIAEFCQKNYGVTFQMFEKVVVTGKNQNPLYKWLSHKDLNGWNDKAPTWNFCKYVIDENGKLTNFFGSDIKPDNKQFLNAVGV
jgi:glutathione peroxidase